MPWNISLLNSAQSGESNRWVLLANSIAGHNRKNSRYEKLPLPPPLTRSIGTCRMQGTVTWAWSYGSSGQLWRGPQSSRGTGDQERARAVAKLDRCRCPRVL